MDSSAGAGVVTVGRWGWMVVGWDWRFGWRGERIWRLRGAGLWWWRSLVVRIGARDAPHLTEGHDQALGTLGTLGKMGTRWVHVAE